MQHSIGYAGRAAQPLYDAAFAVKKRQQPQNGPKGKGILQSLLPTSPIALSKPHGKSMAIKQPDNIVPSGNTHPPSIPPAAMSAVSFSGYLEGPLNPAQSPATYSPVSTGASERVSDSPMEKVAAVGIADPGVEDVTGDICIICWNAERETILAPCGHIAMCK